MIIFGIDGATWKVLDQAIETGYMPFLEKLLDNGNRGTLQSTNPPLTPAAWSSFHMSKNPGYHGVVDFVSWNKDELIPEIVDSSYIGETVWQRLERKNYKTTLINVPMTYPPKPMSAQVITGILTPDAQSQWAYPFDLKQEILNDIPNYRPITLAHKNAAEIESNIDKFLDFAANCIRLRKELSLWFIKKDLQDILVTQFQVIDWIQHALWYGIDPQHPKFDKQLQDKIFKKVYSTVDNAMKEVTDNWQKLKNKNKQIVVLSDHGFQVHKKRILLGNYLYDQGFLDKRAGIKSKINNYLPSKNILKNQSPIELLGRSQWGYAYLNKGHNPEVVYLEISKLISKLKDPKTDQKVIKKIYLASDLFSGDKIDLLPEILIEPIDEYSITASIDKSGNYFEEVIRGKDFHLGIHHLDGIIASSIKTNLPNKIEDFGNWLEKELI